VEFEIRNLESEILRTMTLNPKLETQIPNL